MPKKTTKNNYTFKRIAIIVAILAIIGVIVYGVIVAINESSIPDFNNGSEMSVVELTTNGGVTYEWAVEYENQDIVEFVDKTSQARDDKDGGIVDLHYIFRGKKPGSTIVTFNYGDIFDGHVVESHRYRMEVNRDLQIRITQLN